VADYVVKPLDESTWDDFAELVTANNGVWGGCWCVGFHPEGCHDTANDNRAIKERRVREGTTHAALVYDGDECLGWAQFGSPEELPRIKHRKVYEQELREVPDWRITCFFVHKKHRKRGVADAALGGALELIAQLGGGTVESYPENAEGRKVSSSFLHNGTLALFERHGFERDRQIGKHAWVVRKVVA
jgi:GNAT superfamily N-acetyltransferase